MALFSRYQAWENYVSEELVEAEIKEIRTEADLKVAEARYMATYDPGKGPTTVTAAKAAMGSDAAIVEKRDNLMHFEARRKILAIQRTTLEKTAQLVSRELSRRIGREPVERRGARANP